MNSSFHLANWGQSSVIAAEAEQSSTGEATLTGMRREVEMTQEEAEVVCTRHYLAAAVGQSNAEWHVGMVITIGSMAIWQMINSILM